MTRTATFAQLIEDGVLEIGDGYRAKLSELGGDGPIFLRAASLSDGDIEYGDNDRFDDALRPRLTSKIGRPGDTVITTKGASTGRSAFVGEGAPEFVYSPHLSFWRSRDPDQLDPLFLRYWARSAEFAWQLRAMAASTDMSLYLSLVDQRRLRITLPTRVEQHRIGCSLAQLDEKIELNRRMVPMLDETAWTTFATQYFDHPDHAHWPLEPLADHAETVRGLSYTGAGLTDGEGLPLHNLDSVYEGGGYKRDGIKWYVGDYKDRHLVHPGDVVVANTEQGFGYLLIAYPAIITTRFGEAGLFSHHLYRVRPRKESPLTSRLLYFLLLGGALQTEVAGYANGTTVNMLPRDALERPRFRVPPSEVVQEIEGLSRPLHERAELAEDESETLASLRDALLPRLITGELRISPRDTA